MKFWCIMLSDGDWMYRYFFLYAGSKSDALKRYKQIGELKNCEILDVYEVKQE